MPNQPASSRSGRGCIREQSGEPRHLQGKVAAGFFIYLKKIFFFFCFYFHLGCCFAPKGCFRLLPSPSCTALRCGSSWGPTGIKRSAKVPLQKPRGCTEPASPSHPLKSLGQQNELFSSACTLSSHKLARGIKRLNAPCCLVFITRPEMHCIALKSGRYSGTKKRAWCFVFFVLFCF